MNKIEQAFLQLKWEMERYEASGVDVSLVKAKIKASEDEYKRFKQKTGIVDVCRKQIYIPGGY